MTLNNPALESHTWHGIGYRPLVLTEQWQVAWLNWEPLFERANLGEIERHTETDEVFVLQRGRSGLFVVTPQGIELTEMEPGVIYNVKRGVWHNLIASREAAWLIVEARDTHLSDTEIRQMTALERDQLERQFPAWFIA